MLEHEQVLALIKRAKEGDNDAKEILLTHNSPLIKSVIRRFRHKGIEYDDLYQLGCMGFLKAIRNFCESFGVKFSTYAVPMIAGEVKRFLRDDGYIKVSRATKTLSIQISRFVEDYCVQHGDNPTLEQLAAEFELEPAEIVFAMDSAKLPISIYEHTDDENSQSLLDRLAHKDSLLDIDKIILRDVIDKLNPRERKVIILRYFRDQTQTQVAKVLGVSQVQVSRIESRIIAQLREQLE